MSKLPNPFKIEQEENKLLQSLIEQQKYTNRLLEKLISEQNKNTPSELIKKYYPNSNPGNKIITNTINLTLPGVFVGTPSNPVKINTDERFPTRIWFIKMRIFTINVTDPLIAAQCGIRIFKEGQFFPEPNYNRTIT